VPIPYGTSSLEIMKVESHGHLIKLKSTLLEREEPSLCQEFYLIFSSDFELDFI
jgi:hypothetical protein